jgi:drug/metabolite transporter (DMT)-like permease
VVFTAIIGSKFAKHKLSRTMIMGALLATFGAGFIDGLPHIVWGWGEILTIISAIFFALHILATDNITKKLDPIKISTTSFTFVGIGAGSIGLLSAGEISVASVITTNGVFSQLLLLGFFGTLVCLLLLNIYQKQFHPTHAAIIYAFEPLWATIYALSLNLVEMSYWLLIGGSAVLLGNIIVEIDSHQREEEEE